MRYMAKRAKVCFSVLDFLIAHKTDNILVTKHRRITELLKVRYFIPWNAVPFNHQQRARIPTGSVFEEDYYEIILFRKLPFDRAKSMH